MPITKAATISITSGVTTRDMTTASGAVTIAHGLGVVPKRIKITAFVPSTAKSFGTYDGTTNRCISEMWSGTEGNNNATQILHLEPTNNNDQSAVATFDVTNITLTWTKYGNPTGTAQILWEAFA